MKIALAALVALAFLGNLRAQTTGPDVIVGAIVGVANYSHNNSLGVDAISVGTTSCNVGDQILLWQANNPMHPVIAQHAYRLENGRMEQIGQSWLKHGFAALTGTVCGPCGLPGGQFLSPGCSDPYGASLNGSQSGLGPKREVNAATGVFPYPYGGGNGVGGSVYKRLQLRMNDLDPVQHPNAQYFVEAQYVTQDDTASGNGLNNASWRSLDVSSSGGGFNMTLTGPTHQTEAAIMAWAASDPDVRLKNVDVPGDGRFTIGFKTTDIGGGLFEWEFAVHNYNSHRSARRFEVSVPAGSSITNVGFHDVDYHSGEGFDDSDWTSTVTSDSVSWSTDSYASNQNANALRWGTLYNFRFVADAQTPAQTSLLGEIELFRPGSGATVPFSFDPDSQLEIVSGDGQVVDSGEAFPDPLVVRVVDNQGTILPGVAVTFTDESGALNLTGPTQVVSDANGLAQTTATSTTAGGLGSITASTETDSVDFTLLARRFSVDWYPTVGLLGLIFVGEQGSLPLTLAIDNPQPSVVTPFGTIVTSVLSPQPGLVLISGVPGIGVYDPTFVSNPSGYWNRFFTGLQALAGTGQDAVFQIYATYVDGNGQLQIIISPGRTVVF